MIMIEDLLTPIAGQNPAGESLDSAREWIRISEARHAGSAFSRDEWGAVDDDGVRFSETRDQNGDFAGPDWKEVRKVTRDCLANRSKDLRLAIWFTEANFKIEGLSGLVEGLHLIRELLDRFWDCGLYPEIEEGDVQWRTAPLEWLGPKLQAALLGLPIARHGEESYTYGFFLQTLHIADNDRVNAIRDAIRSTDRSFYAKFLGDLHASETELGELQSNLDRLCGEDSPAFSGTVSKLRELRAHLERLLPPVYDPTPGDATDLSSFAPALAAPVTTPEPARTAWENIRSLLDAGRTADAMEQAGALALHEPSGRDRFHRRLALAEACLNQHVPVATEMLEELAQLAEELNLAAWESPELLARVWQGLLTCYQNASAGTPAAERHDYAFTRLCRVAPWQAIRRLS